MKYNTSMRASLIVTSDEFPNPLDQQFSIEFYYEHPPLILLFFNVSYAELLVVLDRECKFLIPGSLKGQNSIWKKNNMIFT